MDTAADIYQNHLNYVAESIRNHFSDEQLVVYSAKRNTGSLTYDGIEIGAERVAKEIEDLIEQLARDDVCVDRFSIVGYSLGGLVARFVVGLLDHKAYFKRMRPVNFVTFATPHLGVRTPLLGYQNQLWNVLGARTLSQSGRELFMIDNFRQTGRPLLSVLADPESIFIHALAKFETRCLYANVVNDRSAVFYTTAISKYDPYVHMDRLRLRYVENYGPVVLDPERPFDTLSQEDLPTFYDRLRTRGQSSLRRIPILIALGVLIPIAVVGFLINSAVQTIRSQRRIQLHEKDEQGPGRVDRTPLFVQNMRVGLEDAFENFAAIKSLDHVGFKKFPVYIHKSSHSHAAIIVRTSRAAFEEGKLVVKHWLEKEFNL
ncbi:hypothetical protein DV738_g2980, partial [Chaetothyriales sp. CBS 135597]